MSSVEDLNCTQFLKPYPSPANPEAFNFTIPALVITIIKAYRPIHYYVIVCIVSFSVFANFVILVVLARKEMRSAGVNVMMMLIAACDFFCSVSAILQLFLRTTYTYTSYFNAYIQIFADYLAVAFHASSLFLGVGMALCRVRSLNLSNKNRSDWQSPKYALWVALIMCVPVFLISSVFLFVHTIKESEEDGIYLEMSDFSLKDGCLYMKISMMTSGLCFKMFPCVAMLILSFFLLARIEEGKKSSVSVVNRQKDKGQKMDRTSHMIQLTLVVFLVTEFPQALLNASGGFFLVDYFNYYQNLALFSNVLAFTNTTTSFIIYSTLSAKFRKLFMQTFFSKTLVDRFSKKQSVITVRSSGTI